MFRPTLTLLAGSVICAIGLIAAGQGRADSTVEVYDGEQIAQAPATIAAWGGGSVAYSDQASFADGKQSVLVNVNGPYQGGLFIPKTPIPLGAPKSDKTRFIQLAFTLTPATPAPAPKPPRPKSKDGLPDVIGAAPHRSLLHLAQFVDPNAGLPQQPGTADPNAPVTPAAPPPPTIQNLHFIVGLDDGSAVEYTRAIPPTLDGSTWTTMGVPLCTLPWSTSQATSATLKSIAITGDGAGQIYIAYVKIATDTLPITASISGDSEITVSQTGNYTSIVSAGSSNVTWTWDAQDGSPVEHGQSFSHQFPKSGKYQVKLTIADIDGLKDPVTVTYKVVVQQS